MSNIMDAISGLLSNSWRLLMHTYIPGTDIAIGVMLIGLCIMSLGFKFLSIAVGHNVGEGDVGLSASVGFTRKPKTTSLTISKERSLDVR